MNKNLKFDEKFKNEVDKLEKLVRTIYQTEHKNERNEGFVVDGIVNFDKYTQSSTKILWILKEGNSVDGCDMRYELNRLYDESKGRMRVGWTKTFQKIAYTTFGILNKQSIDEMPNHWDGIAGKSVVQSIQKIAFINIKKHCGDSQSNNNELYTAYQRYKDLILKQIETYQPDVIIGGKTLGFMRSDLGLSEKTRLFYRDIDNAGKYTNGFYYNDGRIYVDTYHPNARINEEQYCNNIIKNVCEILK